jgi:hypothetical protein
MVSCQEPSPLKGSKHSEQCHPHDVALGNAFSFVSMGVEARCCPSKSAAHCRHTKRQPFLCNGCPCHVRCHCRCRCHLHCRHQIHHPSLLPLLSQSPIAVAVAVSHCRCSRRQPLPPPSLSCCRQPSLSPLPLPLAIAVSVTIGHRSCHCLWPSPLPCRWPFMRVVALAWQKLYLTN